MFSKLTMRDVTFKGKKVLMRVDFNVPMNKQQEITDESRIVAHLPSIRTVLDQGGSLILMSHLGRPNGKVNPSLSLAPCAKKLEEISGLKVKMAPGCIGNEVERMAKELKEKEVLLLENLRFQIGEEHPEKDPAFAKQLAHLGDLYVDDAFGSAHRAHASICDVARLFPNCAVAGFLLEEEVEYLGKTLKDPARPFFALIGGAKISTKIGVISSFIKKVDGIFIAGGMAFTFLKALGYEVGSSIVENDYLEMAKNMMEECKKKEFPSFYPKISLLQIALKRVQNISS